MSRFVTSNEKVGQTKTNIGPVKWMAPESIAKQAYSPKSGKINTNTEDPLTYFIARRVDVRQCVL